HQRGSNAVLCDQCREKTATSRRGRHSECCTQGTISVGGSHRPWGRDRFSGAASICSQEQQRLSLQTVINDGRDSCFLPRSRIYFRRCFARRSARTKAAAASNPRL